jgi:hypothetical protein
VSFRECPRCEASAFRVGFGAESRVTRDGGATVEICSRCGERESLYGRNPLEQIPLADWPVPISQLLEEERALITMKREGEFRMLSAEDISP